MTKLCPASLRFAFVAASLLGLVACGPGGIGDACSGSAVEDDCEEGAYCTRERSETAGMAPDETPNNERFTCRALCSSNDDCTEEGFACRPADVMRSTCQPVESETSM
jgi:hypothetical protein